jgi:hypothetical protein
MMSRDELWYQLIVADGNARYYGKIENAFRFLETGVRLILLCSTIGDLLALLADSGFQKCLTIISCVSAIIEVVLKPVFKWDEIQKSARKIKLAWIDIRNDYETLWRKLEAERLPNIDANDVLKTETKAEKATGYVPVVQWVVDRAMKAADKAQSNKWGS